MIKIQNLNVNYGLVPVLRDISVEVRKGEIVAIVGANNAGKSTLLRAICGLVRSVSGSITVDGKELTTMPAHEIANLGIAMVPEGRHVFPNLSVEKNLLLGGHTPRARPYREANFEMVYSLFPVLKERRSQKADTLSGGQQQMLAVGRGLMAQPEFLLLDEPSLGLAPLLIRDQFKLLKQLNEQGMTILMSEQNVKVSLSLSSRGYVMLHGRIYLTGPSQELIKDERVTKAYLGLTE